MKQTSLRIGFVSFRFAGTDGVSLEVAKMAAVLEEMGHECFYFAGESDRPAARTHLVPEAHFTYPEVLAFHTALFNAPRRTPEATDWIHRQRETLKAALRRFVTEFRLDALIPQNVLAIPLNIPLALALTELIAETGLPTIAHHHDFSWERRRFLVNGVGDYLQAAFPPDLPSIQHLVINSLARRQLAQRRGVSATLIPNVMDFENPPGDPDDYAQDMRAMLGLRPGELFVLQPTRVIARKGIELSLELLQRLRRPAQLVISHHAGDEGPAYQQRLHDVAAQMGVTINFAGDRFDDVRRRGPAGEKIYSLHDAYAMADLVTYPSLLEGFGNALLETFYFQKPVVVNNYDVYAADIGPLGFDVVLLQDGVTEANVRATAALLEDPVRQARMTATNLALATRHFSFAVLRRALPRLLTAAGAG